MPDPNIMQQKLEELEKRIELLESKGGK